MDEINRKAIERLGDILDTIKSEIDQLADQSTLTTYDEDLKISETILRLTEAFDKIYRNVK